MSTYIKVVIIVLLLAYKGYVKYNRLVHFKQQDFTFSQVHSQNVSQAHFTWGLFSELRDRSHSMSLHDCVQVSFLYEDVVILETHPDALILM